MERITGTLKYFGPTQDGKKATLTGDWSNGKEKAWCMWAETQSLRDAKLVYEHPVDKWEDGKPKWCVNGKPDLVLEVTQNGKVAKTRILVAGDDTATQPGIEGSDPEPAQKLSPEELKARDREQLAETAELYATALAIAATEQVRTFRRPTWRIGDQAIQAGAATVLIALRDAGVRLHPGQAKALRNVLHEIEAGYDSERTK